MCRKKEQVLSTEEKVGSNADTICNEAAAIDSSPDLFYKLPDELFDHIVSFMTPKTLIAARMLSRKWLGLSPVLHISIHSDQEFLNFLRRFSKQVVKTQSVSVDLQYISDKCENLIREFLSLAAKNGVYELSFCGPVYRIPHTSFNSKSLLVLRLDGCYLNYVRKLRGRRLDSLQVLSFSNVSFTTYDFDRLTWISPNLTHLSLKQCSGSGATGVLYLENLKRLKSVQVCETCYDGIVTDSPNLSFLEYSSTSKACKIDLGCCEKLEILKLNTKVIPGIPFMKEFFSNSALLEFVNELCPSSLMGTSFSNDVSILVERSGKGSDMYSFEYARSGYRPVKCSMTSKPSTQGMKNKRKAYQGKARFQAEYTVIIDTSCFKKLRGLVASFTHISVVSFRLCGEILKKGVNIGELRNSCVSPVRRIKHVKLELLCAGPFPLRYSNVLIDAFLCCCYPETLTLKLSKHQNVFIETLREKLKLKGERLKICCKATNVKCWRHFLKDVEIEHTSRTDKQQTKYERIDIRFQWS